MYTNINELISAIKHELFDNKTLLDVKNKLEYYNGTDWKEYIEFSNSTYKRNIMYIDDQFEVVVICWNPLQSTPIHDHPENGCIAKILEGELLEEQYNIIDDVPIKIYESILNVNGITSQIGKKGLHRIINPTLHQTISIHIYSPPKYIPKIY